MQVRINISALGRANWHEYVVRFVFGGLITAVAGLVAQRFGPVIGGLLLAFPAILPATTTLIEKHETDKKHEHGLHGTMRGRAVASVDAAGAAMGSIGLFVFALVVWRFLSRYTPWLVLTAATFCWLIVSVSIWQIRKWM
jgi:hypothetical protein